MRYKQQIGELLPLRLPRNKPKQTGAAAQPRLNKAVARECSPSPSIRWHELAPRPAPEEEDGPKEKIK
jgi:hypothetical protein